MIFGGQVTQPESHFKTPQDNHNHLKLTKHLQWPTLELVAVTFQLKSTNKLWKYLKVIHRLISNGISLETLLFLVSQGKKCPQYLYYLAGIGWRWLLKIGLLKLMDSVGRVSESLMINTGYLVIAFFEVITQFMIIRIQGLDLHHTLKVKNLHL